MILTADRRRWPIAAISIAPTKTCAASEIRYCLDLSPTCGILPSTPCIPACTFDHPATGHEQIAARAAPVFIIHRARHVCAHPPGNALESRCGHNAEQRHPTVRTGAKKRGACQSVLAHPLITYNERRPDQKCYDAASAPKRGRRSRLRQRRPGYSTYAARGSHGGACREKDLHRAPHVSIRY